MQKFKKAQGANPLVVFDVKQQNRFTLRHFIEDVTYNVHNFLEKNKDTMSQDVEQLLSTSSVPLVKHLFTAIGTADMPIDRRSPSVAPNRTPAARKVRAIYTILCDLISNWCRLRCALHSRISWLLWRPFSQHQSVILYDASSPTRPRTVVILTVAR